MTVSFSHIKVYFHLHINVYFIISNIYLIFNDMWTLDLSAKLICVNQQQQLPTTTTCHMCHMCWLSAWERWIYHGALHRGPVHLHPPCSHTSCIPLCFVGGWKCSNGHHIGRHGDTALSRGWQNGNPWPDIGRREVLPKSEIFFWTFVLPNVQCQ